ncbi:MAG: glycosyl transferase family 1 [Lutibacter sp. BRH_c52]|nr:MAG: glycosyl transferase family 1 [Lutibacter sp. BRH_c52]
MKILHGCLAAFYIDNYGYQENILPKMHKLQGHDVEILASTETYIENAKLGYIKPESYLTKEGIPITRIPYTSYLPHFIAKKLRIYEGINNILERFKPDIIFLHDCQFLSIGDIVKYKNKNKNVQIYVDSHTDFINSGKNWISKNILHAIVYKWAAKKIEPYTRKFYGTLPVRVDFLKNVYNISESKIELLVLGIDDSVVDFTKKQEIRKSIRESLNIKNDDFVIVTGGKLDSRKNIHILMKVVSELNNNNIKLIVFGTPNQEMKKEIELLSKGKNIKYIGWLAPENVYNYLFASDLAFFPGTHSVLWEQTIGIGMPCVFKKWEGIQHVDLGGNCLFIDKGDEEEIENTILKIYNNRQLYLAMEKVAVEKGISEFSYFEIAKRAIEQN